MDYHTKTGETVSALRHSHYISVPQAIASSRTHQAMEEAPLIIPAPWPGKPVTLVTLLQGPVLKLPAQWWFTSQTVSRYRLPMQAQRRLRKQQLSNWCADYYFFSIESCKAVLPEVSSLICLCSASIRQSHQGRLTEDTEGTLSAQTTDHNTGIN